MSTTLCGLRILVRLGCAVVLGLACTAVPGAETEPVELRVDPGGDLTAALAQVPAGGRLVLRKGVHPVTRPLRIERAGVTVAGEPGAELHAAPELTTDACLTVAADGVRITGLTLDGEFVVTRAIRSVRGSRDLRIEHCEIRHWGKHGVDLDGTAQVVANCHIHHCLRKIDGARADAHGIVTLHADGLRVESCRIGNCSGDSVQADRGTWQNLEIVDCELFLEPLTESLGGFNAGDLVGENGFDSKREPGLERGRVLIEKCRLWGFDASVEQGNWAALNLKENVAVTVRDCRVERSRIGARLAAVRRGGRLTCQLENCRFENCVTGIRFEDLKSVSAGEAVALAVEGCHLGDCQWHLQFDQYKRVSGQGTWELPQGVSVTRCLFDPSIRIALGTGDPARIREATGALLASGENREERPASQPAERRDTPVRVAAGSVAPRSVKPVDPAAGENMNPVCPRDESHRGRVYRRVAGQLHCRCPSCGTVWTVAQAGESPAAPGQSASPTGVASNRPPAGKSTSQSKPPTVVK